MISHKQSGFVSILVATTIMIILALITIGFARLMQREQRQALDRQLSRQALYAAESGVNEVYTLIKNDTTLPGTKTTCDVGAPLNLTPINAADGIEYTCVLYDQSPKTIDTNINQSESKIYQLKSRTGSNFESVTFTWGNVDTDSNNVGTLPTCASAGVFRPSRNNTIPLLRVDLTNNKSDTGFSRASLVSLTDYLYLSPCTSGGTNSYEYNPNDKGTIIPVNCTGSESQPCQITITGLARSVSFNGEPNVGSSVYYSRIKSIYASANVTVTADDVGGNDVELEGIVTIDVTARASDVVRRLRASISLTDSEELPEAVLQAFDGVCKLLVLNITGTGTLVDSCP